jgi:hypothetical protein
MICAQFLWRGTQSAGLGIRKKLRQWYSISARPELHFITGTALPVDGGVLA